jgi:hypothetical protein
MPSRAETAPIVLKALRLLIDDAKSGAHLPDP